MTDTLPLNVLIEISNTLKAYSTAIAGFGKDKNIFGNTAVQLENSMPLEVILLQMLLFGSHFDLSEDLMYFVLQQSAYFCPTPQVNMSFSTPITGKRLWNLFLTCHRTDEHLWIYRWGKTGRQKVNGYTNLVNHIRIDHPAEDKEAKREDTAFSWSFNASSSAQLTIRKKTQRPSMAGCNPLSPASWRSTLAKATMCSCIFCNRP